jgi:hypothetical protein
MKNNILNKKIQNNDNEYIKFNKYINDSNNRYNFNRNFYAYYTTNKNLNDNYTRNRNFDGANTSNRKLCNITHGASDNYGLYS